MGFNSRVFAFLKKATRSKSAREQDLLQERIEVTERMLEFIEGSYKLLREETETRKQFHLAGLKELDMKIETHLRNGLSEDDLRPLREQRDIYERTGLEYGANWDTMLLETAAREKALRARVHKLKFDASMLSSEQSQ